MERPCTRGGKLGREPRTQREARGTGKYRRD